MALLTPRGKVRELSEDQLKELKDNLRWLLNEGGWNYRALNQALGFQSSSNMLRNMMYDRDNKFSTTRVRYDAIKRLRDETLQPGVVLIAETTPTRKNKAAVIETAPATRRTRRRTATPEVDAFPAATAFEAEAPAVPAAPGVVFNNGDTAFSAHPQEDGTWRLSLVTTCTTEQALAWTQQILATQLSGTVAAAPAAPAVPAEISEGAV